MNQENHQRYNNPELEGIAARYKAMIHSGKFSFFDVSEFIMLIEFYLQNGKINDASEALSYAQKQYPISSELMIINAQMLIDKGENEKALQILSKTGLNEICNPELYLLKGIAQNFLGYKDAARANFEKAIELSDFEKADTLFSIGVNYQSIDDYKSAIYYLLKSLNEAGENINILFELAFSYDKTDELEQAVHYYNRCLDMDTFSDTIWFNLGVAFSKMAEFEKATEAFDYALALNEKNNLAYYNKGNALANQGKYSEAIESYSEYLITDPQSPDALCFVGECYERMDDLENAFKFYSEALKYKPDYPDAIYGIGIVYSLTENFDESYRYICKAIDLCPDNSDYWFSLGNIFSKTNRPDKAIEAYIKATSLDPFDYESWLNLSEMYYQKNLLSKAIKILEDAYKQNSDIALVNYRLAAYNLLKHNTEEGIRYFRRGIHTSFDEHQEVFKFFPDAQKIKEIEQIIKHYNQTQP